METVLEKQNSKSRTARRRTASNGAPRPHLWTVREYYKMGDLGFFDGKRVQLIRGEIIEMSPTKTPHGTALQRVAVILTAVFGPRFTLRQQLPMSFSRFDEPEPDVVVVPGSIDDYDEYHPSSAALIVEIADSSLRLDRTKKAELYAENGIEEYWIVNLKDRCLEVYRHPTRNAVVSFLFSEKLIVGENDVISPLAMGEVEIKVSDMLPRIG